MIFDAKSRFFEVMIYAIYNSNHQYVWYVYVNLFLQFNEEFLMPNDQRKSTAFDFFFPNLWTTDDDPLPRSWTNSTEVLPPPPKKWLAVNTLRVINFAMIVTLLALVQLPGVEKILLFLFGLAALIEGFILMKKVKNISQFFRSRRMKNAPPLLGFAAFVPLVFLGLAVLVAAVITILSSSQVELLNIHPFAIPLIFTIASGIEALLHLYRTCEIREPLWVEELFNLYRAIEHQQPILIDSSRRENIKKKSRHQFGLFFITATFSVVIPVIMVYAASSLYWLGVAATGYLAILLAPLLCDAAKPYFCKRGERDDRSNDQDAAFFASHQGSQFNLVPSGHVTQNTATRASTTIPTHSPSPSSGSTSNFFAERKNNQSEGANRSDASVAQDVKPNNPAGSDRGFITPAETASF